MQKLIAAPFAALALMAAPAIAAEQAKDDTTFLERLFSPSKPTAEKKAQSEQGTKPQAHSVGKESRALNRIQRERAQRGQFGR